MRGLAESCAASSPAAVVRAVCSAARGPGCGHTASASTSGAFGLREGPTERRRRTMGPPMLDMGKNRGGQYMHKRHSVMAAGLPFAAPEFQSAKLRVEYLDEADLGLEALENRFYTLTHNDLNGDLYLTVGNSYNSEQISGWYNRLVRDEILAEWIPGAADDSLTLHVHCHVSGEDQWLAPPALRDFIFQREMSLVLDCIVYAETNFMMIHPEVGGAQVQVHFHSDIPALNRTEDWGALGDRTSWRALPLTVFERLWAFVMREGPSCNLSNHPPELDVALPFVDDETAAGALSSVQGRKEAEAVCLEAVSTSGVVPAKLDPPPAKSTVNAKSASTSHRYSRIQEQYVPVAVPVVVAAARRSSRSGRYT